MYNNWFTKTVAATAQCWIHLWQYRQHCNLYLFIYYFKICTTAM